MTEAKNRSVLNPGEAERPPVIKDRIYGAAEIASTVIKELINSRPLQRLKGVAQYGVPDEFYHKKNYYRFEHCVGVMILLKK